MDIFIKNTLSGLIPLYDSDLQEKKKLKLNQEYRAKVTIPRNLLYHKKYFALLNIGHQNTKMSLEFESYRSVILMRSGFVKIIDTGKGVLYLPESISFAKMNQTEFEKLFNLSLTQIILDIGATKEDILNELINFM